jgi:hypothetical protein
MPSDMRISLGGLGTSLITDLAEAGYANLIPSIAENRDWYFCLSVEVVLPIK